jgi:hypothetical protein
VISVFPNFSKLTIEHQPEVVRLTAGYEPYSDFNFTSLFCWNSDESTAISNLNGNLVINLPDYISGEPVYSLLGINMINESIGALLQITDRLKLVPEVVAELINPNLYISKEDRDNNDYIYELADLASLGGVKYKKKRNKLHSALKELGQDWSISSSASINDSLKLTIKTLSDAWSENSSQTEEEL